MKKIILILLLFASLCFGQYGHRSNVSVVSDTTGNPKNLGLIVIHTSATGSTDTLFYFGMENYLKQIATHGDTVTFKKVKVDTLEGWTTDSLFINDDLVLLKNILFEGTSTNKSYWVDSGGDTVIIIDPNSNPSLTMTDGTAADSVKLYHDGTNFQIVTDAGTGYINVNDDIVTSGKFVAGDSLRVEETALIKGATTINNKIVINDSLRVEETSILKGNITANANLYLDDSLDVDNVLQVSPVEDSVAINGKLYVSGTTSLGTISADSLNLRELTVTDSAFIDTLTSSILRVTGKAFIEDSARIEETLLVKGKSTHNDSLVVLKGLRNESISTLKGDIDARTKVVIGDSLRVEETSLLKGKVTTQADIEVATKVVINDSLRVEETSLLKGAVTANTKLVINDSLRVEETSLLKGTVTTNSDLAVGTKAVVNDSLRVEETSLLKGTVTTNADVAVGTKLVVDDSARVEKTILVKGAATFNSTITVTDDDWYGLRVDGGRMYFDDQTTDELIIQSAKVGIGIDTPEAQLEVNGDGAKIRISTASAPTSYYTDLVCNYNSANTFNLNVNGQIPIKYNYNVSSLILNQNQGNVGIGIVSVPGAKCEISGYKSSDTLLIVRNDVIGRDSTFNVLQDGSTHTTNNMFLDGFINTDRNIKIDLTPKTFWGASSNPDTLLTTLKLQNIKSRTTQKSCGLSSKQGGLMIRHDDTGSGYDRLNIIFPFLEHGIPFCWSVNSYALTQDNDIADIVRMAAGFESIEIIDHTPNHATDFYSGYPVLSTDSSGVSWVSNDTTFLDFNIDTTGYIYYTDADFTGDIVEPNLFITDGNGDLFAYTADVADVFCIASGSQPDTLRLKSPYCLNTNAADPDTLFLQTRYGRTANLVAENNVDFWFSSYECQKVTLDGFYRLRNASIKQMQRLNIPTPSCFVHPGYVGARVYNDTLKAAGIDKKYFLNGGTTSETSGKRTYNVNKTNAYNFQSGFFDFQTTTFKDDKTFIANAIAVHSIIDYKGHFYSSPLKIDSLIQFITEKDIVCLTMSEWIDVLFKTKTDQFVNIMPPLNIDLDDNSIPDGWESVANFATSGGIIADDSCRFYIESTGTIAAVASLGGIEKGYNEFVIWLKGAANDTVNVIFNPDGAGSSITLKFPADQATWTRKTEEESESSWTTIPILNDCSSTDVIISCSAYSSGTVEICGMELRKKRW